MGDETIQFASRFSTAVTRLAELASDDGHAKLRKLHGARLTTVVREALDAVQAVYATGTDAVSDWPEQARRVLAGVASVREALDRAGVDAEARRRARALVAILDSGQARG